MEDEDLTIPQFHEIKIPATDVRSLVWAGDQLIDWCSGGTVYSLDGSVLSGSCPHDESFDAAVTDPTGRFSVIYQRVGTRGLLLDSGEVIREIQRSDYHAEAYEYPVCLLEHRGRTLFVHCPEEYNRLEIEDVLTGE